MLARVQAARLALAESGPSKVRADGDFERVALPNDDGDALRDLLLAEGAQIVIEVGLAYGSSALAIAEALAESDGTRKRHVIIDAFQADFFETGWNALTDAGVADTCSLVRERSQLALARLVDQGFIADAAFVDGSHMFHNVFVDLYYLGELVRPSGLVILDDWQWPSVATAVRYFETNLGWRPINMVHTTRLCAYRLPDHRNEPTFEDFKPFGIDEIR